LGTKILGVEGGRLGMWGWRPGERVKVMGKGVGGGESGGWFGDGWEEWG